MASPQRRPAPGRRKKPSLKSGRPPLLLANLNSEASSSASSTSKPMSLSTTQSVPVAPHHHHHQSRSHSQSSRNTRTVIRAHHVLQKQLARARAADDTAKAAALEAQLAAAGGLKTYQLASTVGQSASRGGDSSRVLVEWLRPEIEARRGNGRRRGEATTTTSPHAATKQAESSSLARRPAPIRVLEIGALSTQNALNIPGTTAVRRIDLRSSGPGIEECDFMAFPLPAAADGAGEWEGGRGYDVLSLSLVLNYVPDARARGDMLRRTTLFFAAAAAGQATDEGGGENGEQGRAWPLLPSLFLVLPAPCVHNSRYLTPDHLTLIMSSLGYGLREDKTTQKLHYSLWHYDSRRQREWIGRGQPTRFRKREINSGGGRNNFCIVLDDGG